ncbi:MAG: hypothetical protein SFW67_31475 [Myxococcaceae bacterium]|nr:hypothetical protein [Myxococcaceae bacterium]
MMTVLLVTALAQTPESLVRQSFGGVSFKAPKSWALSSEDESSKEWGSADDRARLAFSAFPVEPARPAKACVKQLVDALQTEGFVDTSIGGSPAAKKITTDFIGEKEEDKTEANKVTTTTVVGCNGKTKWLLTFSNRTADGAKYGALFRRIVDSISYGK